MHKIIPTFLLCLLALIGQSQNQAKQWYFGYGCALDFNTEPPTALLDNVIDTGEGCASIANENGDLLFYTNGEMVINKNHQIMQNGNGLHGNTSTSQSAIIVPWPLNDDLYFVFTIGAQLERGLKYSVIDISKNNGLGAVIEKNVFMLGHVTEKQTVIPHANGRDYWLIAHPYESDEYHSFLITCDGVQTEAVITAIGTSIDLNTGCCETSSAIGCMKASPNGKMIATTWTAIYDVVDSWAVSIWHLEVLDFDASTGLLSNVQVITQDFQTNLYKSYGVCFSPDNTKLYQSGSRKFNHLLYQYDLQSDDISASQAILRNASPAYGSIEIGPNGKIYIARLNGTTSLTTIDNPNELNPNISNTPLGGQVSTWGLPNLIYDYERDFYNEPIFVSDTTICSSNELFLDATTTNAISYLWNDGIVEPERNITTEGLYYVDIETENCEMLRDSIFVEFNHLACTDNTFCDFIDPSPNPFYDDLTLSEDFEIVLFDAVGKKIFGGLKSQYSFSNLPAGMYFLLIDNCPSPKKIIKLSTN